MDSLHQPKAASNASKYLLFVGIILVAAVSVVLAVILPRINGDTRNKAWTSVACAGSINTDLSTCNQGCGNDTHCASGLICYKQTGAVDGLCRMASNPTSPSCGVTPSPVTSPSTNPTPSLPPISCGGSCVLNGPSTQCATGMSCVAVGGVGVCRNTQCTSSTTCVCPTPTATPVATATPNPVTCATCDWQADLFWGPVLNSFTGYDWTSTLGFSPAPPAPGYNDPNYGNNYNKWPRQVPPLKSSAITWDSPKTRLLGYVNAIGTTTCTVTPGAADKVLTYNIEPSCGNPSYNNAVTATIDRSYAAQGYVVATVTNGSTCSFPIGFATYKAKWTDASPFINQQFFNSETATVAPGQTKILMAKIPTASGNAACYTRPTVTTNTGVGGGGAGGGSVSTQPKSITDYAKP